LSPDGKILATMSRGPRTGMHDRDIQLWDVATGKKRGQLAVSRNCHQVVFSPNSHFLLTVSFGGTLDLWDVATGKVRWRLTAADFDMCRMAFSPDGKKLATSVQGVALP
jgi:WD40 repeat protein